MAVRRPSVLARLSCAGLSCAGLIAAVTVAAPSAGAVPEGPAAASQPAVSRWIVRLAPGADPAAVQIDGVRVLAEQATLSTVVVTADAARAAEVRALPGVVAVAADRAVAAKAYRFGPVTHPWYPHPPQPAPKTEPAKPEPPKRKGKAGVLTNVNEVVGAVEAWRQGWTGRGVDVALVDTGVTPVAALADSTKVVIGPDLSLESQNPQLRYLDANGHGTHMGSIIAGRERAQAAGRQYATDTENFYGVAPDARLVSIKLADHRGFVDVSQMIAAIDWVVAHRNSDGLGIRVLTIAYGTESPQDYRVDPLAYAAEVAWKNGIVVVAAAGNEGGAVPGLANPAYNPWVLAVGATDTRGTAAVSDDIVAPFSARQGGNFHKRGVDIVAPGVAIAAPHVPGSVIADQFPHAALGEGLIAGSGTSQAAAVVSGVVANLLQARPGLTPDQVKALLMATATPLTGVEVAAQGRGEVNLAKALTAAVPTTVQKPESGTGNGSMESARGGFHLAIGKAQLVGELEITGRNWASPVAAGRTVNRTIWGKDGSFNSNPWMVGNAFAADTTSIAGRTWGGRTWPARSWTGAVWAGREWSGQYWGGRSWNGSAWTGGAWVTPVAGGPAARDRAETLWSGAGWKRR